MLEKQSTVNDDSIERDSAVPGREGTATEQAIQSNRLILIPNALYRRVMDRDGEGWRLEGWGS